MKFIVLKKKNIFYELFYRRKECEDIGNTVIMFKNKLLDFCDERFKNLANNILILYSNVISSIIVLEDDCKTLLIKLDRFLKLLFINYRLGDCFNEI